TAPAEMEAGCGMPRGSLPAGIAVGLTDVAGAHCLAEAIGGLYGHPHGYCCAASMPPIMEYNLPVSADKYARLAHAFGLTAGGSPREERAPVRPPVAPELNHRLAPAPPWRPTRAAGARRRGAQARREPRPPPAP